MGNFSLRKTALIFTVGLMSAVFMTLVNSSTTFADNASWDGDSIKYGTDTYTKVPETTVIPGIGDRDAYATQPQSGIVKVLSIPRNPDKSKEIPDVKQFEYKYDEQTRTYSEPRSPNNGDNIVLGAQLGDGAEGEDGGAQATTCAVEGVGWIVCSVSRFLAGAMDKAYDLIKIFLVVKPLTTDTDSGLFQAWDIARGLANACFIIAFLVIVYSQITSVGINNYEIKKMIPRLVIAAILVNVSYYICTIAVDVSNVMGDSIQKALIEIRESLPDPIAQTSWADMTTFLLSGATIGGVGLLAVVSTTGVLALVPLLVPILIGGMLSILVALLVLAARQALITVLVVLSPIAFVAYLLPNTEKHFERWRGLFVNMLMIFPMFSLLFGGAQLASYLIIQNTDQISVVILAMVVQVAPLLITPFLMKISHNLLTQLGGFANNPKKGLTDRSRNWAQNRKEQLTDRHRAIGARRKFAPSRIAYKRHESKILRDSMHKVRQEQISGAIANSDRSKKILSWQKEAELQKSAGDAMGETLFEQDKAKSTSMQRNSGNLHLAQLQTKQLTEADEARWQETLHKRMDPASGERYAQFSTEARAALHALHIAEGNKEAAEKMQKKEYISDLKTDPSLQRLVGGIDPNGATSAYAKAKAADVASNAELVKQIEDSSSIMPGRIAQMRVNLNQAVASGNAEAARAYINMLAKSNNPGISELRTAITELEDQMESNGILDDIKFHVDGHAGLNNDAEDMVTWSRRKGEKITAVGADSRTWSNLTANRFLSQKESTQHLALNTAGAISDATMREILKNPAKVGVKPGVLRRMRAHLGIAEDGTQDRTLP